MTVVSVLSVVVTLAILPRTQVVLHAADGDLDATFGTNGKVTTPFGDEGGSATAVVIQPDGKVVAVGSTITTGPFRFDYDFAVVRYRADGTLDPTFGTAGRVATNFGFLDDLASGVALQPDGKIVVAGDANDNLLGSGPVGTDNDFGLARYLADGSLDTSFDGDGLVMTDIAGHSFDRVTGVAIQSDGKIVAAGQSFDSGFGDRDFALVRYNADGSLDSTFGTGGIVNTDLSENSEVLGGIVLQPDGRIVVAGGVPAGFVAVRYTTDGVLDASFDGDGIATTAVGSGPSTARAVALQADGKIVLAGEAVNADGVRTNYALARYRSDGSLDESFGGTNGTIVTDFPFEMNVATTVAVQADGKIVTAGTIDALGASDFGVTRHNADGSLDATFGTGGVAITDIAGSFDRANAIAIQIDGCLVVVGGAQVPSGSRTPAHFALIRHMGPPPHALTFFLHGRDVPGTLGAFTMNLKAPAAHVVLTDFSRGPSWVSDPVVTGAVLADASFEVVLPCIGPVGVPMTARLAAIDADGSGERLLGEASVGWRRCRADDAIAVPVSTPMALANQRVKLTLQSTIVHEIPLRFGERTFVRASRFVGVP